MQPVPRAVCVGEGLVVLVAREPGPLEHSAIFDRSAGGAEVNVAGVLAGLGIPSAWASKVGADGFGRYLCAAVAERGINIAAVTAEPGARTGIYIKERGGNTGLATDLGPDRSQMHYYRQGSAATELNLEFLDTAPLMTMLANADLIHVTGITPALSWSATQLTVGLAQSSSSLVSFDLNFRPVLWGDRLVLAPDILAGIIREVDVAFIGADEALSVWGVDESERLRAMFSRPQHLIIKHSGGGVTVFDGDQRADVDPLQVDIIEQIGAGDAFAGGFLAGLLAGLPVRARSRLGHLCAAAALTSQADLAPLAWDADVALALVCDEREWSDLRISHAGVPTALKDLRSRAEAVGT